MVESSEDEVLRGGLPMLEEPSSSDEEDVAEVGPKEREEKRVFREGEGRILLMSWNCSGQASKLVDVVDNVGNHIVVIQSAWVECFEGLPRNRWNWILKHEHFIGVRSGGTVEAICGDSPAEGPQKASRFLFARISFDPSRAGIS